MEKYLPLHSSFIVLDSQDIDTDQIIPARFLTQTDKLGLGRSLFYDWRYSGDPGFANDHELNNRAFEGVKILVAGKNFGCGSSREHAVWALHDYGFRAIISPSIGSIFKGNALKNGLLPIEITDQFYEALCAARESEIFLDLEHQRVDLLGGPSLRFDIDRFARTCLLEGVDQLGYLIAQNAKVLAYEKRSSHEL